MGVGGLLQMAASTERSLVVEASVDGSWWEFHFHSQRNFPRKSIEVNTNMKIMWWISLELTERAREDTCHSEQNNFNKIPHKAVSSTEETRTAPPPEQNTIRKTGC